ncbi:MAG TPA: hypothetical protein VGN17_02035 [Bryobacteraceae bacterium]
MFSDILISLDVEHCDNLLSGIKTVEVRRRRPRIGPGTRVWIYSKIPRAAIDAVAVVSEVREGSAESLWRRYSKEVAISRSRFNRYLMGAKTGCAIKFSSVDALQSALPLSELRREVQGFHPPQFFKQLDTEDKARQLLRLLDPRSFKK